MILRNLVQHSASVEQGRATPRPSRPRWLRFADNVATGIAWTLAAFVLTTAFVLWVMSAEGWT